VATSRILFGLPRQNEKEQSEEEVVKTPEFDLTKFAKVLAPGSVVVLAAVLKGLEVAGVKEVTEPVVLLGVLAVVTAAVLGMSFVSAVDIAARAFLSGEGSAQKKADGKEEPKEEVAEKKEAAESAIVPIAPGSLVWLQGDERPRPLLAVAGVGTASRSYLIGSGEVTKMGPEGDKQDAIKGGFKWEAEEKIAATIPAKWKP
jgi:hypothetical protein